VLPQQRAGQFLKGIKPPCLERFALKQFGNNSITTTANPAHYPGQLLQFVYRATFFTHGAAAMAAGVIQVISDVVFSDGGSEGEFQIG